MPVATDTSKGTAGTPDDDVVSIQGVVGGTPVPVSVSGGGDASAANQTTEITKLTSIDGKIPASPATTAKQDTGNTSLASLDTKTPALGQATLANSQPTAPASDWTQPAAQVRTATLQSAATGTGVGTAIDVSGMASLVVGLSGTFVGTVTWQYSLDSTNGVDGTWATLIGGQTLTTGAVNAGTSTAAVVLTFRVAGLKMFRANITAYTSGSITAIARTQANECPFPQTPTALYAPGSTSSVGVSAGVDGLALGTFGLYTIGRNFLYNGASYDMHRTPTTFKVVALTAATAETTIWTPTSGKKFRLMGFVLTCGAASTLTFKDNTSGTTIFAARGTTDTPISPSGMGNGILSTAINQPLTITRGTSCTLDGVVFGTEE